MKNLYLPSSYPKPDELFTAPFAICNTYSSSASLRIYVEVPGARPSSSKASNCSIISSNEAATTG